VSARGAWVLGYTIASVIGDISRFASPKKLVGYTGLTPYANQSGGHDWRGPLVKTQLNRRDGQTPLGEQQGRLSGASTDLNQLLPGVQVAQVHEVVEHLSSRSIEGDGVVIKASSKTKTLGVGCIHLAPMSQQRPNVTQHTQNDLPKRVKSSEARRRHIEVRFAGSDRPLGSLAPLLACACSMNEARGRGERQEGPRGTSKLNREAP